MASLVEQSTAGLSSIGVLGRKEVLSFKDVMPAKPKSGTPTNQYIHRRSHEGQARRSNSRRSGATSQFQDVSQLSYGNGSQLSRGRRSTPTHRSDQTSIQWNGANSRPQSQQGSRPISQMDIRKPLRCLTSRPTSRASCITAEGATLDAPVSTDLQEHALDGVPTPENRHRVAGPLASTCAHLRPSKYDMEQWSKMADDEIKPPKRELVKNSVITRIKNGTLKLTESEITALAELTVPPEKDGDEDNSSRGSSVEVWIDPETPAPAKSSKPLRDARKRQTGYKVAVPQVSVTPLSGRKMSGWNSPVTTAMLQGMASPFDGVGPDRITFYFDRKGMLDSSTAINWSLTVICQDEPLHESCQACGNKSNGFSRHQKMQNAKNTLELDQLRRDAKVKLGVDQKNEDANNPFYQDVQQERYLRLLFEPMNDFWDAMPEEILDERLEKAMSRLSKGVVRGRNRWKVVKQGQLSLRLFARHQHRPSIDDRGRVESGAAGAGILSNEQRTVLLNIFQAYAWRVSGSMTVDLMARSTWFKFLHHCGILGPEVLQVNNPFKQGPPIPTPAQLSPTPGNTSGRPSATPGGSRLVAPRQASMVQSSSEPDLDHFRKGGVSFSHATAVFAMYAEINPVGLGPPTLTFSNWVNAIQHILRGPTFYRSQKEVLMNLFGVCLKRCEHILGIQADKKQQMDNRNDSRRKLLTRRTTTMQPKEGDPLENSQDFGAWLPGAEPGVLGWQSDLAEEQMCEPEVLVLLHEFEAPLFKIFKYYAARPRRVHAECAIPDGFNFRRHATALFIQDNEKEDGENHEPERHPNTESQVSMDPGCFRYMVYELGLFPGVVQLHSVQQHVDISLKRRDAQHLSYEAFIECLLRIAFVFLSIYGNNVQQMAFSKAKCIWLFTLLRHRCYELELPDGLSTDAVWHKTEDMALYVDSMMLKDLVLWPAIDAPVNPRPKVGGSPVNFRGSLTGM